MHVPNYLALRKVQAGKSAIRMHNLITDKVGFILREMWMILMHYFLFYDIISQKLEFTIRKVNVRIIKTSTK